MSPLLLPQELSKYCCKCLENGKEAATDQSGKKEDLVGVKERENLGKKNSSEVEINRAKPSTSHKGAGVSDSEDSDQPLSSSVNMNLSHSA